MGKGPRSRAHAEDRAQRNPKKPDQETVIGMAVLWSKQVGDTRYEVRSAGRTRRLYTNGILHTQYNPARRLTGNLWDLLLLGAFFHDPGGARRVLVLGVGGGAVIRQLQHFVAPDHITAVELNAVHLYVAQRFFGVRRSGRLALVEADARDWLDGYRGPAFDLVIDDLFTDRGGVADRAVPADAGWLRRLGSALAPQGTLVMNFAGNAQLGAAVPLSESDYRAVFRLSTPQNENAVGVFLRRASSSPALRRRLQQVRELDPRRTSGVRYAIRRLR
jgi:hypothetical protein